MATNAAVNASDTLPTGLAATAMAGAGWTCNLGALSCTRNDALAAAASYPVITLTVNVSSNSPASLVNTSVLGGGKTYTADNMASDPTTIIIAPPNFVATATSKSQVGLTWDAVLGATSYQVYGSSNNGPLSWWDLRARTTSRIHR